MNLKLLLQPPLISGKCGSIHGWIHGQCLSWSLHSCSICLSPWWWPMNEWWWLMTEWWIQCSISCPSNPHCLSQCSHGFQPSMLLANLVLKWRKAQSIGPGVVLYVHLDYNLHCIINNSFFSQDSDTFIMPEASGGLWTNYTFNETGVDGRALPTANILWKPPCKYYKP